MRFFFLRGRYFVSIYLVLGIRVIEILGYFFEVYSLEVKSDLFLDRDDLEWVGLGCRSLEGVFGLVWEVGWIFWRRGRRR